MIEIKKKRRAISGFLVIDKPVGLSSNQALQRCKYLLNALKGGHTGSLDPFATGLLPLCFGEATKFSKFLLNADKTYFATFILGKKSSTDDSYGEISFVKDASHLSLEDIKIALRSFEGEQKQVPPMVSALKYNGERLYKLARRGKIIDRESRDICIKSIDIHDFRINKVSLEAEIDITFVVSKGTYIRSIASDLGKSLQVGGYVSKLRRLGSGPFSKSDMVNIETLEALRKNNQFELLDKFLKPLESVLVHLPKVSLDESAGFNLKRGQSVHTSSKLNIGQVKLFMESGEFIGIGEITDNGLVAPKRLVV